MNSLVETQGCEILTKRETFLEKLNNKEKKKILASYLNEKTQNVANGKENAKKIADIVKAIGDCDYITFDDENVSLTIAEMMIANVYANEINNPKASFASLNMAQKVIDNDISNNVGGFTVNFITNGQDLGD